MSSFRHPIQVEYHSTVYAFLKQCPLQLRSVHSPIWTPQKPEHTTAALCPFGYGACCDYDLHTLCCWKQSKYRMMLIRTPSVQDDAGKQHSDQCFMHNGHQKQAGVQIHREMHTYRHEEQAQLRGLAANAHFSSPGPLSRYTRACGQVTSKQSSRPMASNSSTHTP